MHNRQAITQKVGRHRGARSMSHHYANMNSATGQNITENAVLSKT